MYFTLILRRNWLKRATVQIQKYLKQGKKRCVTLDNSDSKRFEYIFGNISHFPFICTIILLCRRTLVSYGTDEPINPIGVFLEKDGGFCFLGPVRFENEPARCGEKSGKHLMGLLAKASFSFLSFSFVSSFQVTLLVFFMLCISAVKFAYEGIKER